MKNQLQMSIFLLFILIASCTIISKKVRNNELNRNLNLEQTTLTQWTVPEIWKELFTESRGAACQAAINQKRILTQIGNEKNTKDQIMSNKSSRFNWIKKWGYGQVAYLFDFLDPIFQKEVTKAFKRIYDEMMVFPNKNTEVYSDPFANKKIIDEAIFVVSANAVQVNEAMKQWGWFIEPGQEDYATNFIANFDINGDGRLNPRELILGTIKYNRNALGSGLCKNCLYEIAKKIDAIFTYLDCDNNGMMGTYELWNNLPKLIRKTRKWNIFSIINKHNIRTGAINDFVLKNNGSISGSLDKDNFRMGILLGFWDRQTNENSIIEDDSRNLKDKRWRENGMIDTNAFNYMKEQEIAELIASKNK